MEDKAVGLLSEAIQWGFAGFSFTLLVLLYLLTRRVLDLFKNATEVIERNTFAISALSTKLDEASKAAAEQRKLLDDLHDRLISRPCIAKEIQ